MSELDDAAMERVLAFMSEPRGRLCCREWSKKLYDSLQLEYRIEFNKHVRTKGEAVFHHSAVRAFGEDFEESVAYQFEFYPKGDYTLYWNRSYGQWSAANERQVGRWTVVGDKVRCESMEGPEVPEGCVRYAPAGYAFELPTSLVMCGKSECTEGDPAKVWEYQARGAPVPDSALGWEAEQGAARETELPPEEVASSAPAPRTPVSEDARFVEVDGELVEVAADIKSNYPEAQWERLMACRIRFGLMGYAS